VGGELSTKTRCPRQPQQQIRDRTQNQRTLMGARHKWDQSTNVHERYPTFRLLRSRRGKGHAELRAIGAIVTNRRENRGFSSQSNPNRMMDASSHGKIIAKSDKVEPDNR
jgi:hypothetical protein